MRGSIKHINKKQNTSQSLTFKLFLVTVFEYPFLSSILAKFPAITDDAISTTHGSTLYTHGYKEHIHIGVIISCVHQIKCRQQNRCQSLW